MQGRNPAPPAPENVLERPLAPRRTLWQQFWTVFRQNRLAVIGLVCFLLFFTTAVAIRRMRRRENRVLDAIADTL